MEDLCIGMSCIVSVVLERLVLSAEISFPVDARALNVTSMHAGSPSLSCRPHPVASLPAGVWMCVSGISVEKDKARCVCLRACVCVCAREISLEVYVFL